MAAEVRIPKAAEVRIPKVAEVRICEGSQSANFPKQPNREFEVARVRIRSRSANSKAAEVGILFVERLQIHRGKLHVI